MKPSSITRLSVAGRATEVIKYNCSRPSNKYMVVVPGNPGVAHFYIPYMQSLHTLLGSVYHLHCISMAGHVLEDIESSEAHNLEEQITHKIDYLDHLNKTSGEQCEFVFSGHSIGAYVCLEALKRRRDLNVAHVIGMFPFLENDLSMSWRVPFRSAFYAKRLTSHVGTLFNLLPEHSRRSVVKAVQGMKEGLLLDTVIRLSQQKLIYNCLFLAETEFDDLEPANVDHSELEDFRSKITLFYTSDDKWASNDMYLKMKAHLPGRVIKLDDSLIHGFVTENRQNAEMARHTAAVLGFMPSKL